VAADLLSQAEHGADSQVFLVTTSKLLASQVKTEIGVNVPLFLLPWLYWKTIPYVKNHHNMICCSHE
jgi:hypothetical protein